MKVDLSVELGGDLVAVAVAAAADVDGGCWTDDETICPSMKPGRLLTSEFLTWIGGLKGVPLMADHHRRRLESEGKNKILQSVYNKKIFML